ncbi:YhaN family protein [Desulfonatronum thioautotrophicum]|uniref:YhaN family protein n=1 Tax=Desulfonatronum thioautotrophicum TaxID=617001 RepID=UPI0005EB0962|nr:YhaN family protein [Desulfonatronum thioautotrophicum]
MKIHRLELAAYGHFTGHCLDFSSSKPGLHVVYGANEAGKSTALRAIRALLYGIEARTTDNFQHEYKNLLIGGTLQNRDGRELVFRRRKRNVGDLLDTDHQVIDQRVLDDFLHGIDESLFATLFGIDHETLVSGGKAILEQQGDVGQALFSAGVGLASLHGIISRLEQESAELFKFSGSKPELNQAIKRHAELKSALRSLCLAGSEWKKQKRAFDALSEQLAETERIRQSVRTDLERLQRLQRALPHMAKRDQLREVGMALADVAHLPGDFGMRVQQALEQNRGAAQKQQEALSRHARLEQRLVGSPVREDILDQAESIDALHKQLGMIHQARRDRPGLHADLLGMRTEAEILLAQAAPALSLDHRDEIKHLLTRRQTILGLGNRMTGLMAAVEQAQSFLQETATALETVEIALLQLPEIPDLDGLSTAVRLAQKAGDLDSRLRKLDMDALLLRQAAAADMARVGLWAGEPESLADRSLPTTESIDRFVDSFKEVADDQKAAAAQRLALQEDLDRVRHDIAVIEQTGTVVTEEELLRCRADRDQGWRLIRRVWLDGDDPQGEILAYAGNMGLPEAFEAGVQAADDAADHLRLAAERVHQFVSKRAEARKLQDQLARAESEAARLEAKQCQIEAQWWELWEPLDLRPRPPREMRVWLEQCLESRRKILEARKAMAEKVSVCDLRQGLLIRLASELRRLNRPYPETASKTAAETAPETAPENASDTGTEAYTDTGGELAPLLTFAEQHLASSKALQDQSARLEAERTRLVRAKTQADSNLADCKEKVAAWQQRWSEALAGFGLSMETSPDEAATVLDALGTGLAKINQADQYARRIADIDASVKQFETAVQALIDSITAPELEGLPMDQAVVKLQSLLKQASSQKTILEKQLADLESLDEDIRQARNSLETTEAQLAELRRMAKVEDNDGLQDARQRFEQWLSTRTELDRHEETLLEIAEGVALEDLEQQRTEVDPDTLPGRIESLRRQISTELEPRIRQLSEQKGEARSELQRMDGGDAAAAKETEIQIALARVRRLADRYIRVRLSALLLKQEVEQYRRKNQGPILTIASRYFAALTLNSFSGLRSDVDDKGSPVLVGVCADGSMKTVAEMSFGTRDQLYLALRLATLEWRLESHEPMPLIADDILINFDDQRTEATLRALADLGRHNQVILFTHHGWVVEKAKTLSRSDLGDDQASDLVRIHSLEAQTG